MSQTGPLRQERFNVPDACQFDLNQPQGRKAPTVRAGQARDARAGLTPPRTAGPPGTRAWGLGPKKTPEGVGRHLLLCLDGLTRHAPHPTSLRRIDVNSPNELLGFSSMF